MRVKEKGLPVLPDHVLRMVLSTIAASAWFVPVMALFPNSEWIRQYQGETFSSPEVYVNVLFLLPIVVGLTQFWFDIVFQVFGVERLGSLLKYMKFLLLFAVSATFLYSLMMRATAIPGKGYALMFALESAVIYNLFMVHYRKRRDRPSQ